MSGNSKNETTLYPEGETINIKYKSNDQLAWVALTFTNNKDEKFYIPIPYWRFRQFAREIEDDALEDMIRKTAFETVMREMDDGCIWNDSI